MIESPADREAYLRELGVDATLVDTGATLRGIFDSPFLVTSWSPTEIGGEGPTFTVRDEDAPARGARLTVDGRTYRIAVPEPDGSGFTVLPLRRDA